MPRQSICSSAPLLDDADAQPLVVYSSISAGVSIRMQPYAVWSIAIKPGGTEILSKLSPAVSRSNAVKHQ